jgi:ankyrin repeat protein
MYPSRRKITNMAGIGHRMNSFGIVIVSFSMVFSFLAFVWAGDMNQSLFKAVRERNISKVKLILGSGIDVNSKDEIGQTALMHACMQGYKDISEFLLSRGADVNAKDDVSGTALMYASSQGNESMVNLLLERKADVNAKDVRNNTALIKAAVRGYTKNARLLIKYGADVNWHGAFSMTPLMWATGMEQIETVLFLLNHGADVNATAKDGVTALMLAAGPVYLEEKQSYGSFMNISIDGGHDKIVRLLLDHGAEVNAKDIHGNTALFYAIQKGDETIKSLLLSYGAK